MGHSHCRSAGTSLPMTNQQISPELVLVDPELALQARRELRLGHTIASSRSQVPTGFEIRRSTRRKTLTSILFVSLFAVGLIAAERIDMMVAGPTSRPLTAGAPNAAWAASAIHRRAQSSHDMSALDTEREILTLLAHAAPGTALAQSTDRRAGNAVVRCKRRGSRVLCVVRRPQQPPVHLAARADGVGVATVIAPSSG